MQTLLCQIVIAHRIACSASYLLRQFLVLLWQVICTPQGEYKYLEENDKARLPVTEERSIAT